VNSKAKRVNKYLTDFGFEFEDEQGKSVKLGTMRNGFLSEERSINF